MVLADLVQSPVCRWGLLVPDVVRKDPEWDRSFSKEEGGADQAEDASVEPLDSAPVELQSTESVSVDSRPRSRGNTPNISEAEREALAKQFHEMWHRWG